MSITIVPVTCRLDADLHADVEASAAAYAAQDGEAMALPVLITTIVRDDLQREQDCMRQRRQAAAAPPARATPASAAAAWPGPLRWGAQPVLASHQRSTKAVGTEEDG